MPRPATPTRDQFAQFETLQTRWNDNDPYGHVNNAVYYYLFDTVVNNYLIQQRLLEIGRSDIIGLVVETKCQYFSPLTYPDPIEAGLAVSHIGTSSVTYELGLFSVGRETAAAAGHFIHVYVNEKDRRPTAISDEFRQAISRLKP